MPKYPTARVERGPTMSSHICCVENSQNDSQPYAPTIIAVARPPSAALSAGTPNASRRAIAKMTRAICSLGTSYMILLSKMVFNAFACSPTIGYRGSNGIGFRSDVPVAVRP